MWAWTLLVILFLLLTAFATAHPLPPNRLRRFFRWAKHVFATKETAQYSVAHWGVSCFSLRAGARNLSEEDRRGFLRVWRSVRERFSSDPSTAVVYADILVSDLMQEHGWASRSSALAVLDDRYRAAHAIAIKRERIEPDELRRAIRLYTVLFDELLGNLTIVPTEPSPAPKMLHREHSA